MTGIVNRHHGLVASLQNENEKAGHHLGSVTIFFLIDFFSLYLESVFDVAVTGETEWRQMACSPPTTHSILPTKISSNETKRTKPSSKLSPAAIMASRVRTTGSNFILASLLASLSYLPFELVAKSTLVLCVGLFVVDPFPTSRLVSVAGVAVVLVITKARQRVLILDANEEEH